MHQNGFITVVLAFIIAALVSAGAYFVATKQAAAPTPVTDEASGSTSAPLPTPSPKPTPQPSPIPVSTPKPTAQFTPTELKYRLEDTLGKALSPCGSPVEEIADEAEVEESMKKQFLIITADSEAFPVILSRLDIMNDGSWTDQEKFAVVREHERISTVSLGLRNGNYFFRINYAPIKPTTTGEASYAEGTIMPDWSITVSKQEYYRHDCPICLAEHTLIDTPSGTVAVERMEEGMTVWTVNERGERVPAVVVQTVKTAVSSTHRVVHLMLDDGRELFVSPGHPTGDGRTIGALAAGDMLDEGRVVGAELVSYTRGYTYDILPSGDTGRYFADGILVGSTLR